MEVDNGAACWDRQGIKNCFWHQRCSIRVEAVGWFGINLQSWRLQPVWALQELVETTNAKAGH
jgi:hypothetical protein